MPTDLPAVIAGNYIARWVGLWDVSFTYQPGDMCYHNATVWQATAGVAVGHEPGVALTWGVYVPVGPQGVPGPPGTSGTAGTAGTAGTPGLDSVVAGPAGGQGIQGVPGVAPGGPIRKTANQTLTLVAATAIADMAFPVEALSTYYFHMVVQITTSTGTAPTTAYSFTGPASPTAVAITREQDTSTSVEAKSAITAFGAFPAGAQVASTGVTFSGVVVTGAAAGTVALLAARAGTTPSMVVAAGSHGFWIKLA
jgi:hypothetical protein